MVQNQASPNKTRQAIILDLSLFILDLLDKNKIRQNVTTQGDILEVPSALVEMLRDSRVGSPVLFLFVYSLLAKTVERYREKQIADPRITNLIRGPDYVVRSKAWEIAQSLYDEFASLIDVAPRTTLLEEIGETKGENTKDRSDYPIRRYDFIGSLPREEQSRLRGIYTSELGLPEHPLYDQYFAQIYHAQTVGEVDGNRVPHKAVSLDDDTFQVVAKWKGKVKLDPKFDKNIIEVTRDFIKWFTTVYIKREWQNLVFDKTLEIAVAGILTGTVSGSFGISLITLGGGELIKAVVETPVIPESWKPFYIMSILLLMFCCLIFVVRPKWFIPPNTLQLTPSNSPPALLVEASPTLIIPTLFETESLIVPTPTTSVTKIDVQNYCLYVVQPGDTIQSVASWFNVSESDIRHSDNLVKQGVFTPHQLIKVNAPCCAQIGVDNGFSYSVKPKDNVFRLAINFLVSVDEIVSANNLRDSRYIQAGQMLCIPYP
jgi:LysM repeat protein